MPRAHIELDKQAVIAPVRRRTFGSFVEHLGRCVYTGLHEPEHPSANGDGFRMDVVELVRELDSTTIRYPGGNFVSGVRWEESVGPREKRPVRRDLAWRSLESNQVGLGEFARRPKLTDSESMPAANVATRGTLPALGLPAYADHPSGTALSDLRIAHGTPDPHNVRMWCLGNEMNGPRQTGFMTADDHGKIAARTAAAMKRADKDLECVVCGSSGSDMPTFGDWERTVLEHSHDRVDYVGEASVIDAVATVDEDRAAVFPVNRDPGEAAQVTIDVRGLGSSRTVEAVTLADSDVYAKNTLVEQYRVIPTANSSATLADGLLTIEPPPTSRTAMTPR
ncbi:alpha-L-arabinofuranosidase C-terminal domain-containing protein [Streptomyces macrosporus]|uniref:non-reducing end alpha-L-arabinofuranosidase n=1 Tax=Streptomyces macrosporus TaxID=44032 RepID=A0ABN3KC52_9ACTN